MRLSSDVFWADFSSSCKWYKIRYLYKMKHISNQIDISYIPRQANTETCHPLATIWEVPFLLCLWLLPSAFWFVWVSRSPRWARPAWTAGPPGRAPGRWRSWWGCPWSPRCCPASAPRPPSPARGATSSPWSCAGTAAFGRAAWRCRCHCGSTAEKWI